MSTPKNIGAQVKALRAGGMKYSDIAAALGCSVSTVSYHCNESQREKTKVRGRKRINKKRLYVQEVKENAVCADCLVDYPYWVLQFDHVRGVKRGDVSRMTQLTAWSIEDLIEEISKCDIVCANCHTTRTFYRGIAASNKNGR